jgi:hypothetical protein
MDLGGHELGWGHPVFAWPLTVAMRLDFLAAVVSPDDRFAPRHDGMKAWSLLVTALLQQSLLDQGEHQLGR